MTYDPPFAIEHRPSNFQNAFTRSFAPKVLQVVHVTGNKEVAAYPEGFDLGESPGQDWAYAARNSASKDGPSAHDYVGRKTGATIQMWDPKTHVAWSNGDLDHPNTKLPGVKYLVDLRARGINANRGCYREIELSGFPGSFDPTDAQLEACAYFAAIDSIATGLDIVRGETVLTHADINSIDRQNCAFRPTIREARMAELVSRALEIRHLLTAPTPEEEVVLNFKILEPALGTVTVKTNDRNYWLVTIDGRLVPAPDGSIRECFARVELLKPLEEYLGKPPHVPTGTPEDDRKTCWLIGRLIPETTNVMVALLLEYAATFTPAPTADVTAAVNAALDHVAAPAAAVLTSIKEARPAS
jgi:hypothetical protein